MQIFLNDGECLVQRNSQPQSGADELVALADSGQPRGKVPSLTGKPVAVQQHIGHLFVLRKTLARSARHDEAPALLREDDGRALPELLRRSKRAAAELDHFFYRFVHNNNQSL